MRAGRRTRILLQAGGGIIIGAACLWLSLRGADPRAVLGDIGEASRLLLVLAVVDVVLVAAAKALRWQWLFPAQSPATGSSRDPEAPPPLPTTFGILMTSQMLNLLIPVRLGEVARVGLMRQEGVPVGATLGTIVVEKSLDLLAVAGLVVLAVPLTVLPGAAPTPARVAGLAAAVALLAVLFLAGHYRQRVAALFQRIPAPAHPWAARLHRNSLRLVHTTLASLAVLEGPRLGRVLLLTASIWALAAGGIMLMLAAFHLPFNGGMALVLMLALTSSNWAPTPPALIGVVGAVTVAVLLPFGVPQTTALALGAALNVVLVAPPVLLGSWAVWQRLLALRSGLRHALGLASHATPQQEG